MLKEKLITLNQPTSLTKILNHLSEGSEKILLRQNINQNKRRICQHALIGAINFSKDEMTLYPQKGEFSFSPHSYLYFFGFRRTTIFKASILYHSRLKMVIRLPKKIMMMNSRQEERENILENGTLIHYTHNPKHDANLIQLYLHSKIIDLSKNGLSFKSSPHNVVRFKKGDHLWLKSPWNPKELKEGQIRHVSKATDVFSNEVYLRVGVKY